MTATRDKAYMSEVGTRLRLTRYALDLTQEQAAADAGVGVSGWNRWENGARLPDVVAMRDFCRRHKLSLDWIFSGEKKDLPLGVAVRVLSPEELFRQAPAIRR